MLTHHQSPLLPLPQFQITSISLFLHYLLTPFYIYLPVFPQYIHQLASLTTFSDSFFRPHPVNCLYSPPSFPSLLPLPPSPPSFPSLLPLPPSPPSFPSLLPLPPSPPSFPSLLPLLSFLLSPSLPPPSLRIFTLRRSFICYKIPKFNI